MTVIFLTSGTSWTVPNDFSAVNTIAAIGAGGYGGDGSFGIIIGNIGPPYYLPIISSTGGCGGGGGAFASISNITLTPGASISYQIGASSSSTYGSYASGANTYFLNTSTLFAQGGQAGTTASFGLGGSSTSCVGTIKYSGGNGASGFYFGNGVGVTPAAPGGGGGGAAGPNGNGGNAATAATGSGSTGGAADNGTVASATNGTEYFNGTIYAGSGGGATSAFSGVGALPTPVPGLYGAGGAGAGNFDSSNYYFYSAKSSGSDGIIIITYVPLKPSGMNMPMLGM